MKSKHNKGLKMDPWGTPQLPNDESDNSLFKATSWVLLNKYDLNQDKEVSLYLYDCNVFKKIWWSTRSNALRKTTMTQPTSFPELHNP